MLTLIACSLLASAEVPAVEVARDRTENGVGIHLGLGTASVDFQSGNFYGFASASFAVPLFSNGTMTAFSIGAGPTVRMSQHWWADFFAVATPGSLGGANLGLGIGAGVHYVSDGGVSFGMKLPILGFDVVHTEGGSGLSYLAFLGEGAIGMPTLTIGYRF